MDKEAADMYSPNTLPGPGEIVLDYLESLNWSQRELALRSGLTPKTVSEICNGKTPITVRTALAFEKVLGRPAHFWLNLQRQYDEAEARVALVAKSDDWFSWANRFPVKEMRDLRLLDNSGISIVDDLLRFFGVSSPSSWEAVWEATSVAYRQTTRFRTSAEAISSWVRASELLAVELESDLEVADFAEDGLRDVCSAIRPLSLLEPEEFVPAIQKLCASVGVLVLWLPELKNTGISGCARWLSEKKALIAMTLRYKTDDHIWFTLFHELGHVLLHRKSTRFILDNAADNLGDTVIDPPMKAREEEANRFAADTLVPPEEYFVFILENDVSDAAIFRAAERMGIAPGILVGRLQHDGLLSQKWGNKLKKRYEWKLRD